jgi:hypothetical protein
MTVINGNAGPTRIVPRRRTLRERWEKDSLCYLAIILALAGVFPHAVGAVTGLIDAIKGVPGPVAVVAPKARPIAIPPPKFNAKIFVNDPSMNMEGSANASEVDSTSEGKIK